MRWQGQHEEAVWLHFHCGSFKKEWLGKVTQDEGLLTAISNASWSVHLRWGTWNKAGKIFSSSRFLVQCFPNPANLWMKKHLKNYWTGENLFLFSYIPLSHLIVLQASYYTCSAISDENPWLSKCGWKVNLFCDNNNVTITYWVKKRVRKFILKTFCYCQSHKILFVFLLYTWGKFYMVKFNYFSGRAN